MTDEQLIQEIKKHRLADLSDGLDALGLVNVGTMNPKMRPIRDGISFVGFAYTVKLIPTQRNVKVCSDIEEYLRELDDWCSDAYAFMSGITEETAKNMVVVIDEGGYPGGVWGSEIAMNTMKKGVVGAVIDGACRDSYECNLEKANVFCTKRTFNHVYGRLNNGGVNIPIQCAGITVNPGDIVCADDDGVLVIRRDKAEKVLEFATVIHKNDQKTRAKHYRDLGYEFDSTLGDIEG